MQPDELSSEAHRSTPRMAGEEEKAISTFEEAIRRIKEATGVTDIQVETWKVKGFAVPAVCGEPICLHTHCAWMYCDMCFFSCV